MPVVPVVADFLAVAADGQEALKLFDMLQRGFEVGDASGPMGSAMMSKMSRESYHRMNRKRGRRTEPDQDGR